MIHVRRARADPPTPDELLELAQLATCGGVHFDLAAIGGDHDALPPRRTCTSTCPLVLYSELCGADPAAGGGAECDHTPVGCTAHANIARFGGFALIPVINT